ncbi:MAG: DUF4476 domain-containing protein [Chitinophagales bacterium]|nr:DUF4476 domain-containing protein [Chitinophagales bacterium]
MKHLITFSIISLWGISLLLANPRDFPQNSNYGNHQQSGHGSTNNNHNGNHNNYNTGHNHNNNQHGSHGYQHYSGHQHYKPSHYHQPQVVITPRPIFFPRPVVHVAPQINPFYGNSVPYGNAFNYKDFINTIRNQRFESDKLSIARQGLYNNLFDTYQIREIMSAFDFEDSKLEFAKEAYNSCVDKQNYYKVNAAFRFSDSVQKLEEYIFTRR